LAKNTQPIAIAEQFEQSGYFVGLIGKCFNRRVQNSLPVYIVRPLISFRGFGWSMNDPN